MTHAELTAAGCDVSAAAHQRLSGFVELLLEENRHLNLTAVRDAQTAWVTHVCDSLALLPLIRDRRPATLLDLGSGGGLPGIPLACVADDVHVTLLDATRKKLTAVERIVSRLGLSNVALICGRAEVLAHDADHRERYDAVTARAVAELRVLIEYAAGFVRPGGQCWFFKSGGEVQQEIAAAEDAASTCSLSAQPIHSYSLPRADGGRIIAVYTKRQPLRDDLPRGPGRPAKRPL